MSTAWASSNFSPRPQKKIDTVSGCEDIMHKTVHDDVIYPEKEVPVDKPVAPMVLVSHVQVN